MIKSISGLRHLYHKIIYSGLGKIKSMHKMGKEKSKMMLQLIRLCPNSTLVYVFVIYTFSFHLSVYAELV